MKKVFVLGGTGFLGYHTIQELLKKGYQVKTLSLPPLPEDGLLPDEVENQLNDINTMSDDEVLELLNDVDGFIYAIGADERILPQKPAWKFFYEANVLPTQRLARLAKQAGVQSFVVFGSYFAEFAERLPETGLASHAYPGTRLLQEQVAFCEGEGSMRVSSLRLPYIFGSMPGRVPLWKMFADMIRDKEQYPVLGGGTAMVTATQVAQAAVAAMEIGRHRATYAISDTNMKYKDFYELIVEALGQETTIPLVSYESMLPHYEAADAHAESEGKEHGIHVVLTSLLQTKDLYLDPKETRDELGFEVEDDMIQVIQDTLKLCV